MQSALTGPLISITHLVPYDALLLLLSAAYLLESPDMISVIFASSVFSLVLPSNLHARFRLYL